VTSTLLLVVSSGWFARPALTQQSGGPFTINPSVLSGGGGTSSNGSTSITGSIGQAVLGRSSAGTFSLDGGFWQAAATPCAAPAITSQPSAQVICAGQQAGFSVTASGAGISYQWRKNTVNLTGGGNISGATSATLTVNPAAAGDAGPYDCVVSAPCGSSAISNPATLTVNGYSLSSPSASFPGAGGIGSFNVITAASCAWTAVSNDAWITITSVANGTGNGTVNYSVAAAATQRIGTITAAGLTHTVNQMGPTAITLSSFTATGYDNGVMLEWETGFEVDNLGFRIHRESAGRRALVNQEPVAGSALVAGSTALTAGRAYAWWDKANADCGSGMADCRNAQYWLEDLDLNGQSTWHGPFYVKQLGGKPPAQSQAALLSSIGRQDDDRTRIVEPFAELVRANQPASSPVSLQQASLALSRAAKISVKQAGWHRVTQAELAAAGFDVKADPRMLRLFVDGRELPIVVAGKEDGRLDSSDAVEFYGLGLNTASTDTRVYWLLADSQRGLRIADEVFAKGYPSGESFPFTVERRDRTIYFSALRNGDEENFFGAVITGNALDQRLTLNNISQTAREPMMIEVALQGVTNLAHQVSVTLNGSSIARVLFSGQEKGRAKIEVPHAMLREGENVVALQSINGSSDVSLVDFIRITYQHSYRAENESLSLTAKSGEMVTIHGFSTKDVRVFDVTDERDVQRLAVSIDQTKEGYSATVTAPNASGAATSGRRLLALTGARVHRASSVRLNQPSNWRSANNAADLVIITARNLISPLDPLKKTREAEGYKVAVVDVDDLYDEFSFGNRSPGSVRDFLSLARASWQRAPRFVLFAGDASYDPKNYLGFGENDLVPTKLIDTAYMETASDDWFSDFDGDGVPDVATGRLPVRSAEEAITAISKIIRYQQTEQASSALLVSDQNDGFNFEQASSQLRVFIPPSVAVEEIRRGQLDPGEARARLFEALARGQKLVNYAGHGSLNQWRGSLLDSDYAGGLTNGDRLPVFVMMTCLNGYFHDALIDSLGESLMKAEQGGAVAVWASSGLTLPQAQALLNQALYRSMFNASILKQPPTLGEAIRSAKSEISDIDVRRTWVLLGDPTLRLK